MQTAVCKNIPVTEICVEWKLGHETRDTYDGDDVSSWGLHLLQDVSESMTLESKKGYEDHQFFILRFMEDAESRQGKNSMDRLAEIKDLSFGGGWTKCVATRLHIDDGDQLGYGDSRSQKRSPYVVG